MRHFSLILITLSFCSSLAAATITRGPYLQLQTDSSIIVRWRTDVPTESVVRYGDSPVSLPLSVMGPGTTTEHSVLIDNLAPASRYYYSVGNNSGALAGDESYHFSTAPTAGSAKDTRIWVIGDSGTANQNARDVRDAYQNWSTSNPADLWLMLGDNAYNSGTDAEYQAAVFDTYPVQLRQLPLWSTLGNHDGYTADSATQSGPYYDIFSLPTDAEAGGWPSGTEAYYSFDYGNIHFICLDSYDSNRSANGAMLEWLMTDLAFNDKPWVIAFWHHPPYTKGSHDSDTELHLIEMRQNALPILEAQGVDLVLTGHSHSYERSKLIDHHYGSSASFDATQHALDSGDGRDGGDGAYEKPDSVRAPNAGAVYAVAGSSGKVSNGYPLDHPAMFISLASLGSLVLDVNGNQLDGTFIDQAGVARDSFTIRKGPDDKPPILTGANAPDATTVIAQFSEGLESTSAADPGNYSIAGLSILSAEWLGDTRQVQLTTSNMEDGTPYSLDVSNVQDNAGNVIAAGATANFTYYNLVTTSFQDAIAPSLAYAGTRDAYMREASPNTNYGLANSLQVDGDEPSGSSSDMNALLMWDVTAIPGGSIVQSAEMVLNVINVGGTYYCYGLQRAWIEAEVNWNQATASTLWGNPGAEAGSDRSSEALCSINATSTGPLVIPLNAAGLAQVQTWIDNPTANNGIILSDSLSSNGADFNSRESTTALDRPRLNVTYRTGTTPEYIDQFAESDVSTDGSNSGGYINTFDDDGIVQVLTERVSGGKKRNRTSQMEHTWRFSVVPGSAVTLHANTWSGGSTDSDAFVFTWSTDNTNYQELFIVNSTSVDNVQSAAIGGSGTIYVRVQDTNREAGNQQQDSIYIDHLYIRSNNGEPPPNQAPSALFTWNCTGLTCDFSDMSSDIDGRVTAWSWEFGDATNSTEQNPRRVYESPGTYSVSLTVTDDDGETDYRDAIISVSATHSIMLESPNTYKVRGYHHIDLAWSGATTAEVDLYRDNNLISTFANDGAYTDRTGSKGGRTYVYKVCEVSSTRCSNEVEAAF